MSAITAVPLGVATRNVKNTNGVIYTQFGLLQNVELVEADNMDKLRLSTLINKLKEDFINSFRELDEHSWKFEVITEDKRSQVVSLIYKKANHSNKDISRYIAFSPIGPIPKKFDFENILRLNSELDIGTIAIEDLKNDEGFKIPYLVFRATHLAPTADYPEIYELITKTGEYADSLENKIFSKDTH